MKQIIVVHQGKHSRMLLCFDEEARKYYKFKRVDGEKEYNVYFGNARLDAFVGLDTEADEQVINTLKKIDLKIK